MASASCLNASLIQDAKSNNDNKMKDLLDEYKSILNGEIQNINLFNLRRWLSNSLKSSHLAKQAARQKELITTEVNKAIKLIKKQPSLILNQSKNSRNILMYVAAINSIKQVEEILDSLPNDEWSSKWKLLAGQYDSSTKDILDYSGTNSTYSLYL